MITTNTNTIVDPMITTNTNTANRDEFSNTDEWGNHPMIDFDKIDRLVIQHGTTTDPTNQQIRLKQLNSSNISAFTPYI